jgi:hypothetical protein
LWHGAAQDGKGGKLGSAAPPAILQAGLATYIDVYTGVYATDHRTGNGGLAVNGCLPHGPLRWRDRPEPAIARLPWRVASSYAAKNSR